MTDYVLSVGEREGLIHVAVSVVRLMTAPGQQYTLADAERILEKKLKGVNQSNKTCQGCWQRQILHVWSPSVGNTRLFRKAIDLLSRNSNSHLLDNVVIIVTTASHFPELFSPHSDIVGYHGNRSIHRLDSVRSNLGLERVHRTSMPARRQWRCPVAYFIFPCFPGWFTR